MCCSLTPNYKHIQLITHKHCLIWLDRQRDRHMYRQTGRHTVLLLNRYVLIKSTCMYVWCGWHSQTQRSLLGLTEKQACNTHCDRSLMYFRCSPSTCCVCPPSCWTHTEIHACTHRLYHTFMILSKIGSDQIELWLSSLTLGLGACVGNLSSNCAYFSNLLTFYNLRSSFY